MSVKLFTDIMIHNSQPEIIKLTLYNIYVATHLKDEI